MCACYHPKIRVEDTTKWETAKDGHKYHPAKIISPAKHDGLKEINSHGLKYKYQIIPCRNCIGCRLDYSREWANRGYLELKTNNFENCWFVTLTYDDDNLQIEPEIKIDEISYLNDGTWNGNLIPKDLEQFIKNIRQYFSRNYNKNGIKYMACGEYGDKNKRPHYHIIFYDLPLPVNDLKDTTISNKEFYYHSNIIEQYWKKGLHNISEASWNNIAYVARYIVKKQYGKESEHEYAKKGQIKEFFRVSKGIGKMYYQRNAKEIYENDEILIRNKKGVQTTKPPKYYDRLLKSENLEKLERIKRNRKASNERALTQKDKTTSLSREEQLLVEERSKAESVLGLRRKI